MSKVFDVNFVPRWDLVPARVFAPALLDQAPLADRELLVVRRRGFGERQVSLILILFNEWFSSRRRFSFRCRLPLHLLSSGRVRRRLDFASLLLPAFEYLILAPHLFFERPPLVFVSPVYLFRRSLAWLRPLYSLPILQRLAFARLLYLELALFGFFAAANLSGVRSWGSPWRFDMAWRAVRRLPFNPGAIEDHVAASNFNAAAWRATFHNALAQYCAS